MIKKTIKFILKKIGYVRSEKLILRSTYAIDKRTYKIV